MHCVFSLAERLASVTSCNPKTFLFTCYILIPWKLVPNKAAKKIIFIIMFRKTQDLVSSHIAVSEVAFNKHQNMSLAF